MIGNVCGRLLLERFAIEVLKIHLVIELERVI